VAHKLIDISDVVLVNLSANVTHKWGLQYEVLRKTNPALIMLCMPGFGMTGPYRDYVSFGATIEALSGLATSTGYPDGDPIGSGLFHFPDWLNGMQGLTAVLAALDHRRRTGQGQFIDMSQMEVMVSAFGPLLLEAFLDPKAPDRRGNLSYVAAPHNAYPCKGHDQWCVIGCYSNEEWERLCAVIGRPELGKDKRFATHRDRERNLDQIDVILSEWTLQRDPMEAMDTLQKAGIHAAKVFHIKELTEDPNLKSQNFFTMLPHLCRVLKPGERRLVKPPEMGEVLATGLAIDLKEMPGHVWRAGPGWGADNRLIFRELMGIPPARLEALSKADVIEGPA
jgi:crotonobetainyl-CoA:carnitine CoA-transferase CaiB-like acyl-CoA transferase